MKLRNQGHALDRRLGLCVGHSRRKWATVPDALLIAQLIDGATKKKQHLNEPTASIVKAG
jgi:hypothetical protein